MAHGEWPEQVNTVNFCTCASILLDTQFNNSILFIANSLIETLSLYEILYVQLMVIIYETIWI